MNSATASHAGWRSPEVAIAAAVTLLIVAVRIAFGLQNNYCGTPDACNYLGVAQALGSGKGFSARFLFDLQQNTITFPTHAIEYWRPGTSFFLLLARPFGAITLHSGMVVTALAAVGLAAAAWVLAIRTTGSRRIALASYLLCFLLPPSWSESITPDSGMFYGLAVAWFLVLFAVRRQSVTQDIAALLCVAVTYSIRNDGMLLLIPLLAVLWQRRRSSLPGASRTYAALMLAGFVLALAPMHVLNHAVLGTAFPSGAGRALYMESFDNFSEYRQPVNLQTLLATGAPHLLAKRVSTFASVIYRNLALGIGFAVVFLPTLWLGRRSAAQNGDAKNRDAAIPELTGGAAFLLVVLVMYTLVMPAIGEFSALRAFYGLIPLLSTLVIAGIVRLARDTRLAQGLIVSVLVVYTVNGILADRRKLYELAEVGDPIREMGDELRAAGISPASAVILTDSPVQVSVTTGYATAVLPSNGEAAMRGLAQEVGATHALAYPPYPAGMIAGMRAALQPQQEIVLPKSRVRVMVLHIPQR